MEKVRARVFISGRVQGVFYRAWTRKRAKDLGLTGWVRNLSDGRVEAVFEGKKENVQKLIAECKEGSKIARVENIEVEWEEATGEFSQFEVAETQT